MTELTKGQRNEIVSLIIRVHGLLHVSATPEEIERVLDMQLTPLPPREPDIVFDREDEE
jgi:hypothetical protein